MSTLKLLRDLAVGTGAGLFASKAMSPATSKLYEFQSEEAGLALAAGVEAGWRLLGGQPR